MQIYFLTGCYMEEFMHLKVEEDHRTKWVEKMCRCRGKNCEIRIVLIFQACKIATDKGSGGIWCLGRRRAPRSHKGLKLSQVGQALGSWVNVEALQTIDHQRMFHIAFCSFLFYNYFQMQLFFDRLEAYWNTQHNLTKIHQQDVTNDLLITSYTILDCPEAVLQMRIRELEKLESHLRQQVCIDYAL